MKREKLEERFEEQICLISSNDLIRLCAHYLNLREASLKGISENQLIRMLKVNMTSIQLADYLDTK